MVNCVFLYNPGAAYIEEVVAILRHPNLDIRKIEADSDIVSNLVPKVLQRGAEFWLIFFLPDKQKDLLILPCAPNFRGYLTNLIPLLSDYFKYESLHIPPDWIGRFQYIRHDASLNTLLTEPFDMDRSRSDVQSTLLRTSQSIQQQRSEVLSKVIRNRDPILIDSILNELDAVFATENDKIFEYLQTTQGFVEFVPSIVTDFEDIIDDETKQFLITSETVLPSEI